MAEVPPVMEDENCFDCYETATLVVPEGSIDAYKNADWWRKFTHINGDVNPGIPGDLNGDGEIALGDVNALIDHVLSRDDYDSVYDVNGDGEINISDINVLINMILSGR